MGPKNSVPNATNGNDKTDNIYTIKHPKFSNVKFLKDPKTEEQYFQTSMPIVNEKEYDIWVNRLKEIPSKSQILMIAKNHKFQKEGLCGSNGIVKIDFENYPFLLSDEIINRSSNHKQFQQNQLWYLLFTLITAAKDFHQQNKKVGDIKPQNIFINEDGQIKVSSQYSFPGQQINYNKTFYERQVTYLSPEEIKDIQFGKVQSSQPIDTSESFSIGVTVLDASLLSNSNDIYLKTGKFDYEKLQDKLQNLKKLGTYSQLFVLTIFNLCQIQGINRSTPKEIYQWLTPFEDSIFNLEQFQVNNLPQKIILTKNKAFNKPNNQPINQPSVVKNNPPVSKIQQPINYIPPNSLPVTHSHYVQQIRQTYQQPNLPPRQIVQQRISQFPRQVITNNRIIAQQLPPNNYHVGQPMNVPIQGGYTRVVGHIPSKMMVIPNYNQIPINENQVRHLKKPQEVNYPNYHETNRPHSTDKNNHQTIDLQKIDQQLKMSRKLFPS